MIKRESSGPRRLEHGVCDSPNCSFCLAVETANVCPSKHQAKAARRLEITSVRWTASKRRHRSASASPPEAAPGGAETGPIASRQSQVPNDPTPVGYWSSSDDFFQISERSPNSTRESIPGLCPLWMRLSASRLGLQCKTILGNGSSAWIRTRNPPVNSVTQVLGLAGSSCR
jgi:hypothetical protein